MVGQPIDRGHPRVPQAVHLPKLAQMEQQGELSGHGPQCQEGGQDLGQQEEEVDGVNGSLQRQDDNFFIGQEEEQHRQLEHEREEPEGRQLWHLMTGGRETQDGSVSGEAGGAQIEQSGITSTLAADEIHSAVVAQS